MQRHVCRQERPVPMQPNTLPAALASIPRNGDIHGSVDSRQKSPMDGRGPVADRRTPEIENGPGPSCIVRRHQSANGWPIALGIYTAAPSPTCQYRRHPSALHRKARVPNRVHAPMHAKQPAGPHAPRDTAWRDATQEQLPCRDDPVLARGDFSQFPISVGDFLPHTGIKPPSTTDSPPAAVELPAMCGRRCYWGGGESTATNPSLGTKRPTRAA